MVKFFKDTDLNIVLLTGSTNKRNKTQIYEQLKNENNPNFTYKANKTGLIFENISGYNVLGAHGELNNLPDALKDYSDIYDESLSKVLILISLFTESPSSDNKY